MFCFNFLTAFHFIPVHFEEDLSWVTTRRRVKIKAFLKNVRNITLIELLYILHWHFGFYKNKFLLIRIKNPFWKLTMTVLF